MRKKALFVMAGALAMSMSLYMNVYAEELLPGSDSGNVVVATAPVDGASAGTELSASAETVSNGPAVGTAVNAALEFGPTAGGNSSNSATGADTSSGTGSQDTTAAQTTVTDAYSDTLTLPSGYHFNNIDAYTYQNMVDDLSVMQSVYPEMKMDVLATTPDNRNIYHVVVGNPQASHKILVHAGIHAREYIVCQVVMRQMASLLEMQKNGEVYNGCAVKDLLQNTCIHFVPMVNPDGITLVQGGIDALNTDAAKMSVLKIAEMDGATDLAAYLKTWKNNINGVNLNRNFDANWEQASEKVAHPSSMNYKGTSAECEIESKTLADLARSIMPEVTLSYHTQGRVIYWYFGETGTYKDRGFNLANIVHNNTNYSISNSWSEKDAAGFKDWAVQKLDIPSVTIECGLGTSPVEESQINRIWAENDGILPDVMIDLVCR
ncbi:M14 family zinc carboxypeptidase [Oribacterium sp. WCC10]|uniref:M14 family zinc carboxypeptidase n=1 Tax=Oribacterium sp. WCC10 TaxID=1855343 RepID=UPI0008E0C401|nr:M14 family zinc carboxypeptidase [Oribacterium sp. WCC10]SFG05597.1 g-D-glutamyl-meso-diaminopimelate peptidase [Oribacterium sp. WCC10]